MHKLCTHACVLLHLCIHTHALYVYVRTRAYARTTSYFTFFPLLAWTTKLSTDSLFAPWQTATLPRHASTDTTLLGFSVEHSALHPWKRAFCLAWHVSWHLWCTISINNMYFCCYVLRMMCTLSFYYGLPGTLWGSFLCRPDCRKLPSKLFRSNWRLGQTRSKTRDRIENNVFFDPNSDRSHLHLIWIEKCRRGFLAAGILEKRETPPDRSWRELRHILRRERPTSSISGAKAHANVLKGGLFQQTANTTA